MSTVLGVIVALAVLAMGVGMLLGAVFTAGPFFATYKYELELDHLRIDVFFFGKLPFPGLKIPYENIASVARSSDSECKFDLLRLSYASVWRLFNGVTITLKKRICLRLIRMIVIAPIEPDAFVVRLRAKL